MTNRTRLLFAATALLLVAAASRGQDDEAPASIPGKQRAELPEPVAECNPCRSTVKEVTQQEAKKRDDLQARIDRLLLDLHTERLMAMVLFGIVIVAVVWCLDKNKTRRRWMR